MIADRIESPELAPGEWLPTPEEIAAACREIQADWPPEEFAFREGATPGRLHYVKRFRDACCEECGRAVRLRKIARFCPDCARARENRRRRERYRETGK